MMLYYRADLFEQLGLTVPKTWDEFEAVARAGPCQGHQALPGHLLLGRPGLVRRARRAGRRELVDQRERHLVGVHQRRADQEDGRRSGADLVNEGVLSGKPMYTPEWNKAMSDGTLLAWPSADLGRRRAGGRRAEHQGQVGDGPDAAVGRRHAGHRLLGRLRDRDRGEVHAAGPGGEVRQVAATPTPRRPRGDDHGRRHLPGRDRGQSSPALSSAAGDDAEPARRSSPTPPRSRRPPAASPGRRTSTSPTASTATCSPRPSRQGRLRRRRRPACRRPRSPT